MAKYRISYQDATDYNKTSTIWITDSYDSDHLGSAAGTILTPQIAIAIRDLIDTANDPISPSTIHEYTREDITPI